MAETIKIGAVGDVMMGSEGRWPKNGPAGLFKAVKPYLSENDINFYNNEGVLTDVGTCVKKPVKGKVYAFKTPPEYAKYLGDAGFNMASLANNHTFDYAHEGLNRTTEALGDHGIVSSHHSGSIARMNVRGVRVAMAAFWIYSGDPHDLNNIPQAKRITAKLAKESDVTIISFHAGAEGLDFIHVPKGPEKYLGETRGDVMAFARAVVDSGADLVLGHGPHVPRAMEIYKDRLIAYSLGNFCTIGFGLKSHLGQAPLLVAEVDETGKLTGGSVVSFVQRRLDGPILDKDNAAAKLIFKLGTEDFPKSNALGPDGRIVIQK